jgi:hypothetical protein
MFSLIWREKKKNLMWNNCECNQQGTTIQVNLLLPYSNK